MRPARWSILLALVLSGCLSAHDKDPHPPASPADFATAATPPPASHPAAEPPVLPIPASQSTPATPPNPTPSQMARPLAVDAMVGQVNGKPIYASAVFEDNDKALTAMGKKYASRLMFMQEAKGLLARQLYVTLLNSLKLGEANRDLSAPEQEYLQGMLTEHRAELIRQEGGGSIAVANEQSVAHTTKTIEERTNDYRDIVVVRRFLYRKFSPQINITRKNIEHYYAEHYDEFNPPPTRTLRVIRTDDPDEASQIDRRLAAGESFDKVAASNLNHFRTDDAGLMSDKITTDKFFAFDELNNAMVQLKEGQHSARLKGDKFFWWIKIEKYDSFKPRPLPEVQVQIRTLLFNQQSQRLEDDYDAKLLVDAGYYDNLHRPTAETEKMLDALLDVAVNRYALPE